MFFAARETVERWAAAKDAKAEARGREEGREEGRKQVVALLEGHNVPLQPDILRKLKGAQNRTDQSMPGPTA